MEALALYEAKARLTALVHEVEEGQEVALTRHGKEVAVLMGLERYRLLKDGASCLSQAMARYRATLEEDPGDAFEDLRDRDTGRRVDL